MAIDATGSSSLAKLASSYKTTDTKEEEDYLGREAFLTMLVAQLQNQDPLNPMEGSDFSAQLAQFSSLEQLINLNSSMKSMAESFASSSEIDASAFIGKEVTGNANTVEINSGAIFGGYYKLSEQSEVMVTIYNADGNVVKTIYPGQQTSGEYGIDWDGTDNSGNVVEDGSYTYEVLANTGSGYAAVSTAITGKVDSLTYQNGKAYLDIDGVLISPDSIIKVSEAKSDTGSDASVTPLDYLGKSISYSGHLLGVENSEVSGSGIKFDLESQEDVVIDVLDSKGNVVNSVEVAAENTVAGQNEVKWDGTDSSGNAVDDGIYSYSVRSESGNAKQSESGEVTGIKYVNGTQYLVVGDNGDLVSLSSVTGVNAN